tara:strand:+ start:3077 stop:5032 length:1956 start_codon:yes stop_codon:yes gene_type:complete
MDKILNVALETQTAPRIRETASKDWVLFGTEDNENLYPQFLVDLYYNSSTHASIINSTAEMIAGEDIKCDEEDNLDTYVKLKKFLANVNGKETMHELVKKLAFDFKLYGAYAINVIYSLDRTEIVELHHIPVERIRSAKANAMGVVDTYFVSANWADTRQNEPQPVPAFNTNNRTSPSQILYTGRYSPEMDAYYAPDYVSGCNWALIDQHIAEFHLNNIQNGFAGSYFISFANGVPTQEERFAIESSLKSKFTGTNAAGRFVLTFSESKDRIPEITPIAMSNADKQYLALGELIQQNLLVSHRVTSPVLCGIRSDTGLGNNSEELNSAFEVYLNTVIAGYQKNILSTLNKILNVNDIAVPLYFVQAKPITTTFDIEDMRSVMTQAEIREQLGLANLEETEEVADEDMDYNSHNFSNQTKLEHWIENHGEIDDKDGDWEVIDDNDMGNEPTDFNFEDELNDLAYTMLPNTELVRTSAPGSRVDSKGSQDGQSKQTEYRDALYRVRYYYTRDKSLKYKAGSKSRLFCRAMMAASDRGKVYKKDELAPNQNFANNLSSISANKGWGPGGTDNYDVFKWKGGGNCFHRFYRRIYRTRIGDRMGLDDAKVISTTQARSEGFKPPTNAQQVPVAPKVMPGAGFVNPALRKKYNDPNA